MLFSHPSGLPNIHSCLCQTFCFICFQCLWRPPSPVFFSSQAGGLLSVQMPLMQSPGLLALPHIFFLSVLPFGEPLLSAFYFSIKHSQEEVLFSTSSGRSLSTICSSFHPQPSSFYLYSLYFDYLILPSHFCCLQLFFSSCCEFLSLT